MRKLRELEISIKHLRQQIRLSRQRLEHLSERKSLQWEKSFLKHIGLLRKEGDLIEAQTKLVAARTDWIITPSKSTPPTATD